MLKGGMQNMHEVAVIQGIVKTILVSMEDAGASRVTNVQLVLGASGHFTEEAVHQHFQALTQNTPIEGATLALSWVPATYQCLSCQHRFESTSSMATCPQCGDMAMEISHQDVCYLSAIDVVIAHE
jgi:hydrogenase nickel incorporation protein HypA/HybF